MSGLLVQGGSITVQDGALFHGTGHAGDLDCCCEGDSGFCLMCMNIFTPPSFIMSISGVVYGGETSGPCPAAVPDHDIVLALSDGYPCGLGSYSVPFADRDIIADGDCVMTMWVAGLPCVTNLYCCGDDFFNPPKYEYFRLCISATGWEDGSFQAYYRVLITENCQIPLGVYPYYPEIHEPCQVGVGNFNVGSPGIITLSIP